MDRYTPGKKGSFTVQNISQETEKVSVNSQVVELENQQVSKRKLKFTLPSNKGKKSWERVFSEESVYLKPQSETFRINYILGGKKKSTWFGWHLNQSKYKKRKWICCSRVETTHFNSFTSSSLSTMYVSFYWLFWLEHTLANTLPLSKLLRLSESCLSQETASFKGPSIRVRSITLKSRRAQRAIKTGSRQRTVNRVWLQLNKQQNNLKWKKLTGNNPKC